LKQAQTAVQIALPRLKGFGILTTRPDDYFAEMSKTDKHMKKVRATLLTKHAEIEKRDKIRKLRELKKMGKSIQVENELKKAKEKKKKYKSEAEFKEATGEKGDNKKQKNPTVKDKKWAVFWLLLTLYFTMS
jgi:rRNA-processing protein EBP2